MKRFRKLLALVMAVCMVCAVSATAWAEESQVMDPKKPIAILVGPSDEEYPIEGTLVDCVRPRSIGGEGYQTYAFNIPVPYASNDHLVTDNDPTVSVQAKLRIYYKNKGITPDEYLLTQVSGGYGIMDSQVSVASSKLIYGCVGAFPEEVNQRVEKNLTVNSFDYNTNFAKYVTSEFGVVGARYTLNLRRGTNSSWEFVVPNNFFGAMS